MHPTQTVKTNSPHMPKYKYSASTHHKIQLKNCIKVIIQSLSTFIIFKEDLELHTPN